jgi:hypothetical protein
MAGAAWADGIAILPRVVLIAAESRRDMLLQVVSTIRLSALSLVTLDSYNPPLSSLPRPLRP